MNLKDNGEIERELVAILGPERVLKDRSKTKEYATGSMHVTFPGVSDHWRYAGDFASHYWPDFVVLPDSTEQVSSILALANRKQIPVVPWGGGTNTYGSTLAIKGGIVVDLRKMDRILEIDKEEQVVIAEAGINLLELQYLLNEQGLCHGTNPGSAPWATLGGAICCEAHTLAGFEYGTAVDNILGLTVVIPTGEILRTKSRYCGGYNLNQLFTRSEGTLGIVTEVKMRVSRMPEYTRNIGFVFDSFADTILTQNEILKNIFPYPGIVTAYDNFNPLYSSLFQEEGEGILLMTLEGHREIVDVEEKMIRSIVAGRRGTELAASRADLVQDWWTMFMGKSIARYEKASKGQLLPERIGPHIWIPRTQSIWSRNTFKDLAEKSGIKYAGCINYPTRQSVAVSVDQSKPEEIAAYRKMIREFAVLVREKGGSISGAHGCGLTFKEELRAELQNGFSVMEKIKAALDPKGIMNPGKLF
jgi:FAD/FMN-containing dehydrogenase